VTRFVLIPGAGGASWYWSYVVERLHAAGHDATAVDLPADDETAGLDDYTEITLTAIDGRPDVVVVAQSLGGFTAAQVAARTTLAGLVFVNAMIPLPGETAGEWWGNVGTSVTAAATDTPYDQYTGQLQMGGSVQMTSTAAGQEATVTGHVDANGNFVGSWDLPFGGCVQHIPNATGFFKP
jgi:pimeloyl-ACP methyl ester carboxylesterase